MSDSFATAPIQSLIDVTERLIALGHLAANESTIVQVGELLAGIEAFQKQNGLVITRELDEPTIKLLYNPRRCGLPDTLRAAGDCKWPQPVVTWHFAASLPGLSFNDSRNAYIEALNAWASVCGVVFQEASKPEKANIRVGSGRGEMLNFDGVGGTLGWSYMPCGAAKDTQLRQMYDEDETWGHRMAVAVFTHEIGHALGLLHDVQGSLMAPYYNPRISTPQPADIEKITALYGPPKG